MSIRIMGYDIDPYKHPETGPYTLKVKFTHGKELIQARGHNPQTVREAHTRVSRNPKVIESIELHDLTGCLETIWRRP